MLTLQRISASIAHRSKTLVRRAAQRWAARGSAPKDVDERTRRVFALVTQRLTREPYPPGYRIATRWCDKLRAALADARKAPSARLLAYLGLTIFDLDMVKLSQSEREFLVECRRRYNEKHPELSTLRESELCTANTIVAVGAGTHSQKMDQAFSYYEHIYAGVPQSEPLNVIAEIGSGYGRLARIMHLVDSRRRYILIDLPESLIFAYAFLAMHFPAASMLFVSSPDEAESASKEQFAFVFCPIQFIERLAWPTVDLLINTYSLAEMPQESVNHLMKCIHETLRPRFFYSLNMMFSNRDIHYDTGGHDGEANEVALPLEPQWCIRHFDLVPASINGLPRLTAAAVFDRVDNPAAAITAATSAASRLPSGTAARVANLYFAALWGRDPEKTRRFVDELSDYWASCGISCEIEHIGEVRHLRRALTESAKCSSP